MEIIAYRSPHERRGDTAELGLVIALASLGMLFAALLFAYGVLRLHGGRESSFAQGRWHYGSWGVGLTIVMSFLLQGLRLVRLGRPRELSAFLIPGLFTALLFVALFGLSLWHVAPRLSGASPSEQLLAGILLLFGLGAAAGCVGLAWLLMSSLDGRYSAASHLPVRLWLAYWFALNIVWVAVAVAVWTL